MRMDKKRMGKKEIVELVSAFAMVGLIAGVVITIFAESDTAIGEVGMVMVVVGFCVVAVCQVIVWIGRKMK